MNRLTLASVAMAIGLAAGGAKAQEPLLGRTRQLTFEGRRAGEGYFDPAGTRVIFQGEREPGNPFYQIYILDLETGDSHRVSPGTGKTTCAFFRPGADRVMFASTHLDPESRALQEAELEMRASGRERRYAWDYDENFDIFEANPDGSAIVRLTAALGYDAEGSYSPDGSKIVFSSNRDAFPLDALSDEDQRQYAVDPAYFAEIYIMDADGGNPTRLTRTAGYDGGPFFSPDGERIVWRRFTPDGLRADIYTMKTDGSDVKRLTRFESMSWAPFYHPSGDYLIFASNKHGFENFELFIVDARGASEPVRVTGTAGFDGLAVFSPDGTQLLWTSTRYRPGGGREGGQLYLAQWDDAAAREALAEGAAFPRHEFEPEIREADLKAAVQFLASEPLGGRLTGSEGERLAGAWIARRMEQIGLTPLEEGGDWFGEFEFIAGIEAGPGSSLTRWSIEANPHIAIEDRARERRGEQSFAPQVEFLPLGLSDETTVEAPLAFAGYGLVVTDDAGNVVYDSYEGLDVSGRIVLALRYVPEGLDAERKAVFNRYSGLRYKALMARERGAVGLLVVSGPNSPDAGELARLENDMGGGSSGIAAASVTLEAASQLLGSSAAEFLAMQDRLAAGEAVEGLTIEDSLVRLSVDLEKNTRVGRNIVGVLPPTGGGADGAQFLVIGAHYDHLGRGLGGSSLAREDERGSVHPGADDNASGTAAMLEIAEHMAASGGERGAGIIFAAWSGEELGLLGSTAFLESSLAGPEAMIAYLNMDMVGRVEANKLSVQGVGSSDDWRRLIERKNVPAGFALGLNDDPYLPTDSMAFYLKGVPGLHFFSGSHEDYHRPTDVAERVNYEDLARVAALVESIAVEIAGRGLRPAYAEVERPGSMRQGGDVMRAYLGTIPDYVVEGEGVKLSGVTAGSPADLGGLRAGDVIVELAGQRIANIYDYTFALDAVTIGKPVAVIVMREGERIELTVTPAARK